MKSVSKKFIGSIFTICLLLSGFFLLSTGCTSKPKAITTITIWHYYGAGIKAQFDTLVQEFNNTVGKEKGIIVDAFGHGGVNELANAVMASARKDVGSSPMPNIFALYSDHAFQLDQLDVIAPLDKYFSAEELSEFRPEFIDNSRFDKEKSLKIIPIAKSSELLFMDKGQFDEFATATGAKIEDLTTWEGIAKTSELYYNWSDGKGLFGIDSLPNFLIIGTKQLGVDLLQVENNNVKFNFTTEIAKKFWDNYYVPFIKGYYVSVGRFRSDDVKSGLIKMFTGSTSSASFFPKNIETSKGSSYTTQPYVLPFPYFENGEKYAMEQGAGMLVSKNTPEVETACVEFLKWFTDPKQNINFSISTSYLPVKNSALSYDSTIKALGTSDINDIRVQAAKSTYDMLETYKLYSSVPFETSAEVRNTLNKVFLNFSQESLEKFNERIKNGEDRNTLLEEFTSEEAFNQWYNYVLTEINALL